MAIFEALLFTIGTSLDKKFLLYSYNYYNKSVLQIVISFKDSSKVVNLYDEQNIIQILAVLGKEIIY